MSTSSRIHDIKRVGHIHFVGIIGVGMTALALCAQDLGIKVSGSDAKDAFIVDDVLKRRGISWKAGFSEENLTPRPDLVVTTGAHGGLKNPEVVAARKQGIPVMTHAQALGAMTRGKDTIAVVGVGGKSTTSAMIAHILKVVECYPSFAVGVGNIMSLGTPGKFDKDGQEFVVEGDEFAVSPGIDDRPRFSFLNPKIVVLTNIEHDHPDIYKTLQDELKVFSEFVQKVPKGGLLVANRDNKNVESLISKIAVPTQTFGIRDGDWKVGNLHFSQGKTIFELHGDEKIQKIELLVPGEFNAMNATAAFAVCSFLGLAPGKIASALSSFKGTKRRFEKKGEVGNILVYDDYAHHPTEIKATLKAARQWYPKRRIFAVFQPHTYTRTKALFQEFAKSFKDADEVALMDIYAAAREKKLKGVTSKKLAQETSKHHRDIYYTGGHNPTVDYLVEHSKPGDVIMVLGAGDIFQIHKKLIPKLKEKYG